mgnify:CR=1 FL=1
MNEKNRFNETETEMTEETSSTEAVSETEQEGDQHEAQEAEALSAPEAPETAETAGDEADEAPAEENAAADDAETISAQEAESTEAAAEEEPVIEVSEASEETAHTDNTESHAAQGERIIEAQSAPAQGNKSVKAKKAPKLIQLTSGRLALLVAVCLAVSLLGGLGGSYIVSGMGSSSVIVPDTSGTVNTTSDSSGTIKAVVESCADSVVEIQTESISSGNSLFQQYVSSGAGSGVILTQDGYIVTNHHVIEGATSILVRTRSGDEYSAELIGSDEQSDLAVLKIDASGLTPAVLGDSTKLEVGDLAVVIGNPLGELGGTVTSGIISALDREVSIDGQTMTLMQTDAAVNPGNSGGGLFDANGDLVGIINAKSSGDNVEGLGFAIPISRDRHHRRAHRKRRSLPSRPTLGVSLYDVTDRNTAAQLGVDSTGVYIVQIVQGGSADRAGLQTGDRIISVDGTEVNSTEEVRAALNEHSTGEQMNMEIERDGNTIEVMVSL